MSTHRYKWHPSGIGLDYVKLIGDEMRTIERNADVLLNAYNDTGLAVNIGKTKYMEIELHPGWWQMSISR